MTQDLPKLTLYQFLLDRMVPPEDKVQGEIYFDSEGVKEELLSVFFDSSFYLQKFSILQKKDGLINLLARQNSMQKEKEMSRMIRQAHGLPEPEEENPDAQDYSKFTTDLQTLLNKEISELEILHNLTKFLESLETFREDSERKKLVENFLLKKVTVTLGEEKTERWERRGPPDYLSTSLVLECRGIKQPCKILCYPFIQGSRSTPIDFIHEKEEEKSHPSAQFLVEVYSEALTMVKQLAEAEEDAAAQASKALTEPFPSEEPSMPLPLLVLSMFVEEDARVIADAARAATGPAVLEAEQARNQLKPR